MYIVVSISLLALLLTYFESTVKLKSGMKYGFIFVTILGVIHYDYGNDYMAYFDSYNNITKYNFDITMILNRDIYREPGWSMLCWAFKPIGGFFMMVAVLNIIQNLIIYKFIKRYVCKKWWPLAIGIYLFTTTYYLYSFSMMRQEFVVIVFLGLWSIIEKRKWWIALVVLWLCSFIHSSAMFLIPFVFWGVLPVNNKKLISAIYIIFFVILWVFGDMLNDIFVFITSMDASFSNYVDTYSVDSKGLNIGVGVIINIIPFILSVRYLMSKEKDISENQKRLVALAAVYFLIMPFGGIIRIVSRLGIYFGVYSIASIPLIYNNVKIVKIRYGLLILYVLIMMYDYYLFFNSPIFGKSYATFHTIFSQF